MLQDKMISYHSSVLETRQPKHNVHPIFVNRWSNRSFSSQQVTEEQINTVLEAARWSPSAFNAQPWRFVVASAEEDKDIFKQFIFERNRVWTDHAPVYILLASETDQGEGKTNTFHAFDAGNAWAAIAFQAHLIGLQTRAVAGFDHQKARELLELSPTLSLHVVIALGYSGELADLDERFHTMNKPSERKPLEEFIIPIIK